MSISGTEIALGLTLKIWAICSTSAALLGAADGAFLLTKAKRTANDAMLDIAGRDQQDQRLHLVRNTKTLLWEMESAETELWEEETDPLLEEVARVVSEDNPKLEGSVTALAKQIQYNASPISLAMKLNVCADRLKQDYHIRYERYRSHKGRGIRLTLETHKQNSTIASNPVSA